MAAFTPDARPRTSSTAVDPLPTEQLAESKDPDDRSEGENCGSIVQTPPNQHNHDSLSAPSTPPTSPETYDHRTPTTPPRHTKSPVTPSRNKSTTTPLYRRFKREVAMSPATPPRSPTRQKHDSPSRGRSTPVKRSESPTKQKLEVGLNGFHFVCELPMSKVTPKKAAESGTPKKGTTSRPPSPVKMEAASLDIGSAGKNQGRQTPSKAAHGSPAKAATPSKTTPARSAKPTTAGSAHKGTPARILFGSPAREAAKGTSKNATPARLHFGTPLRNVATPESDKHVKSTKASPTKSVKMASKYAQGSPAVPTPTSCASRDSRAQAHQEATTDGKAVAGNSSDPFNTSSSTQSGSRPWAVKEKSYDIGGLMASFQAHKKQCGVPGLPESATINSSAPPTPLRRAARRLEVAPVIHYKEHGVGATKEEAHIHGPLEATPVDGAVDGSELDQVTAPAEPIEAVKISEPVAFALDEGIVSHHITPTLNPTQQSLNEPPSPLLFSRGVTGEQAPLHYTPLLFPSDNSASKSSSSPHSPKKHVHFPSDNALASPAKPKATKTPQRVGTDPAVLLAMQKEMDSLKQSLSSSLGVPYDFPSYGPANEFELPVMSNATKATRTLQRTSSDVTHTSNGTASSLSTVRPSMRVDTEASNQTPKSAHKSTAPAIRKTPARPKNQQHKLPPVSNPPAASSRKNAVSKPPARGTPRSARQSIVEARRPAPPKPPSSARKPISTPTPSHTTTKDAQTRPRLKTFVSATDIACRVATWNNQPSTTTHPSLPSSSNIAPKHSFTPPGSPTKPPAAPTPTRRPAIKTPSRHLAKPAPRTPALNSPTRTLAKPAPRTPALRKIMDPNAFRTPSKEIEGSLDRAIDRKIEEDRRRRVGG